MPDVPALLPLPAMSGQAVKKVIHTHLDYHTPFHGQQA